MYKIRKNKGGFMTKYLFLIPITLLFLGCSNKSVTINSLAPSKIETPKINKIIIEEFENDNINFADYLENEIINKKINNQKVFFLQPTYETSDAIITGKILSKNMYHDVYFDEDIDYNICVKHKISDDKKKRRSKCLKYKTRRIPCEKFDYRTEIKFQVLDKNENLLFSKIYTQTDHFQKCYENRFNRPNYLYLHTLYKPKVDFKRYKKLAEKIASRAVDDIAPHYIYQKVLLMEEINSLKLSEKLTKEFEFANELLENRYFSKANLKLHRLNELVDFKSYEIFYNLALSYEAQDLLYKAKKFYIKAEAICNDLDKLKLIQTSIIRVQKNLENKIKAKSQLIEK